MIINSNNDNDTKRLLPTNWNKKYVLKHDKWIWIKMNKWIN